MIGSRGWASAFGELTLIVVGVLIALGVDQWNARRGEARLESEYLARLTDDLHADTAAIGVIFELLERKDQSLARVAAAFAPAAGAVADTTDLLRDIVLGSHFAWAHPPVRNITYRELESTGNLRLVRDPELRAEIIAYYYLAEHGEDRVDGRRTGYGPLTLAFIPRGTDDFRVAGLTAAEHADVLDRVRASGIPQMATAERNFGASLRQDRKELHERASALLTRIEQREDPGQ